MDLPLEDGVRRVLDGANKQHGMSWELVRKLAGGYQRGAYELKDRVQGRAVLKWHTGHLPPMQLEATAQAIEDARVRGWPTARWLAHGPLPNNGAYIIEQFIEGERPRSLGGVVLDRLLDAIRLQADARPDTDQDWSAYIHRVMFEGEAELAARMRERPETNDLLRRLEQLTAAARDLQLQANDLVHGDFVLNNVLVRDGQPYLVDAAHAGKGTRAYDLATLLIETTVGGDYAAPSTSDQRRLERECVAIVGRLGCLVCVGCRIIHLLVFGGVHWGEEVPRTVTKCHAFLDSLETTQSERK
jgi:hypothetical protein